MNRVIKKTQSTLRKYLVDTATYEGSGGTVWFAGPEMRAPSIAQFFAGPDVGSAHGSRMLLRKVPDRIVDVAGNGGLAILRVRRPDPQLARILPRSIAVPSLVDVHVDLPDDGDELRTQLRSSTTKEDFRRIRKAGFTYRVTTDPAAIREFHARHYAPLVAKQYPEDGRVVPVDRMLRDLDRGGELVCADIDGEWVAGIFNVAGDETYALITLGIRDADDAVRHKRVVAALIVRSLERGVELGKRRGTLGRSLPFLGKGPVWFKVKWDGKVTRDPSTHDMHMFMDLRHPGVRRMLAATPVVHRQGDDLVVAAWLDDGDAAREVLLREARRYPGIARWFVLGEPDVIAAANVELTATGQIVPVPVVPSGSTPRWLGDALPGPG